MVQVQNKLVIGWGKNKVFPNPIRIEGFVRTTKPFAKGKVVILGKCINIKLT